MKKSFKWFLHLFALGFITFWICFYSFGVYRYHKLPWWNPVNNDMDAVHVATTIGLVNGSGYSLVYHPAATLFEAHGIVYRLMSLFKGDGRNLTRLSAAPDLSAAMNILGTGVSVSRILVSLTTVLFAGILYVFLYALFRSILPAFLMTFYIVISRGHLNHLTMIRAEILTLLFFYAALAVTYISLRKKQISENRLLGTFLCAGILLGHAVFAKIQIGPAVVLFVFAAMVYTASAGKQIVLRGKKSSRACLGLSLISISVFPWWTFMRPVFLSADFFARLSKYSDLWKVYGPAPEHFLFLPVSVLGILFALSLAVFLFRKKETKWSGAVTRGLFAAHGLTIGFSFSVYLIFAFISRNVFQYWQNTRHLVYAVLTNVSYGGYLWNKEFGMATWRKVIGRLDWANIFTVNPFMIVLTVFAAGCLLAFICRKKDLLRPLALCAGFIVLGLAMDVLATMRSKTYYSYYFIYSVTFYGSALAAGLSAVFSCEFKDPRARQAGVIVKYTVLSLLALHMIFQCVKIWDLKNTIQVKRHSPKKEFQNIQSHCQPFFDIVNRTAEKN